PRGWPNPGPGSRERGVDPDVDQVRAAAREPAADRRTDVRGLVHARAGDAERAGQADEVDQRAVEVHRDVAVVLGREALERLRPLLENPVRRVGSVTLNPWSCWPAVRSIGAPDLLAS